MEVTIIRLDHCVWLRRGMVPVIIGAVHLAVTRQVQPKPPLLIPHELLEEELENNQREQEYWSLLGFKS